MQNFFKDIPSIKVKVSKGLHLKSCMSMLTKDTIIISLADSAVNLREEIQSKSDFRNNYQFVHVEKDKPSNVLSLNNFIIYPSGYDKCYENVRKSQNSKEHRIAVANGEFEKIDGCLTCLSVFFSSGAK